MQILCKYCVNIVQILFKYSLVERKWEQVFSSVWCCFKFFGNLLTYLLTWEISRVACATKKSKNVTYIDGITVGWQPGWLSQRRAGWESLSQEVKLLKWSLNSGEYDDLIDLREDLKKTDYLVTLIVFRPPKHDIWQND